MRFFISGNADVCRMHLPVAQSRAIEFADRCKKAGLSQNSMAFAFDDTGTQVSIQYVFGQVQVQMSAPTFERVEESVEEQEIVPPEPGTFYIETAQGYFWVRVRNGVDDNPIVLLEKFEAMKDSGNPFSEGFVYPAMAHRTPGMLSGSFGTEGNRYVLSQAGGVFVGKGQEKGTVKLPPTGAKWARINVEDNTQAIGRFCIIENERGQSCFFKYLKVEVDDQGEILIELKHGNVNMLVEGESGGILPANLLKTPCWIHRKCTGSYFSSNKTIGYHTDIGSDDDYFGNADQVAPGVFAIPSGIQDKLDNGDPDIGSYFNHTQALYRIASFAAGPLKISDSSITLVLVSPTMIWDAESMDDLGWGGYGNTTFGCIDQRQDFTRVILAPRFCAVTYDFKTGGKVVVDLAGTLDSGGNDTTIKLNTWDSFGFADFNIWSDIKCGPKHFYEQFGTDEVGEACGWTDEGTSYCMSGKIPVYLEIPKEQRYFQHAAVSFEENLTVKRHAEFRFGGQAYLHSLDERNKNFYFMFNGLWHETFAAMWLTSSSVSNQCGLCAHPPWSQVPGGNVIFMVDGSVPNGLTQQWLAENATEYVINMQIVEPLAVRPIQLPMNNKPVDMLSFIAKVPEHLVAPNPPEVLVGGIKYPSPDVEGETVECEYTLMSAPCECGGGISFDTNPNKCGSFLTTTHGKACVAGGCAPFAWSMQGGVLHDIEGVMYGSSVITDRTYFLIIVDDYACSAQLKVKDVCDAEAQLAAENMGGQRPLYGPPYLYWETEAEYTHNFGPLATYTGSMIEVEKRENSSILRMPESITEPTQIRFDGPCSWFAEMVVTPGYCDCEGTTAKWASYASWSSWLTVFGGGLGVIGGCGPFSWSITGGSFVDINGNPLDDLSETETRYVKVVVHPPNCNVSVSVTDLQCGTTLTKEAVREEGGYISGPDVVPAGGSAWFTHDIPNANYSGGMINIQQQSGMILLKMPEEATSTQTFTLSGDCGMFAEKDVEPSYCKCEDASMAWGQYSQDIALDSTAHMYFSGGCPPFSWSGSNVSFVNSSGATIPYQDRKNLRALYVRSNNECQGSMNVSDRCGNNLSRSKSISGTSGTVTGPSSLQPGTTGTFYHSLGAGATYTGTLEMVQQASNGAVLRMPDGASGSYTASWTASCGRSASVSVQAMGNERCCGIGTGGCARIYFSGPVLPSVWCSTDGRWKTKGSCANCSNWWCAKDTGGGAFSFTTTEWKHGASECACSNCNGGKGYYGIPLYT